LFPDAMSRGGRRGGSNGYLAAQAAGAASELAVARGEVCSPAHLLVAVVDQADPEVVATLVDAGIRPPDVRRVAVGLLGGPPERPPLELPPLTMPALVAAGTWDRPALEISQLHSGAWASLRWRQERLPLNRIRRRWHWHALFALEQVAALRVADRFGVDDDQRYSLLSQHMDEVRAVAHGVRPDLVRTRDQMRSDYPPASIRWRRRRAWETVVPGFLMGWPTWFANRGVDIRDRYFWLITIPGYRGQPGPTG
jgi:hypothetical protein